VLTGDHTPSYTQQWSKVDATKFPGGTYKFSNVKNFPASSKMSATLITLYPGGLRELHWHEEVEWAFVLNGTCRCSFTSSTLHL
jgi:oxalate decarboxylase